MHQDKLRQHVKRLSASIRSILTQDWDPIGVCDKGENQDEYDSYIPVIIRMLNEDCDLDGLAEHLRHVESVHIGLSNHDRSEAVQRRARVAARLIELAEY